MRHAFLTADYSLITSAFRLPRFPGPYQAIENMKIPATLAVERALALAKRVVGRGRSDAHRSAGTVAGIACGAGGRAARLLAEQRIDAGEVLGRWPNLTRCVENQANWQLRPTVSRATSCGSASGFPSRGEREAPRSIC